MKTVAVAAAVLVGVVACGSFSEVERPGGNTDGGADGAATDAGADPSAACPGSAGPAMVRAGSFCIDATEVTRGQYKQFVDAKAGDTSGQMPACSGNASFEPSEGWPFAPGSERMPVTHVDWCDAYAFCQWAGKRLCGRIGGGPMDPSSDALRRADRDQWFAACTRGGTRAYPYGDAYAADRCNLGRPSGNTDEVASFPECEGGYEGLFDMSGNVLEWEDACTSTSPDADCVIRSSGFFEDQSVADCAAYRSTQQKRIGTYGFIGIRCCSE